MVASIFASQQPAFRVTYDPDAVALFARMTVQPNDARKKLISDTIVGFKTSGIWDKLDCLYFTAAHDAQAARLNWKQDLYNLLAVNSPVFTTDRGYLGDGTSSYLNTGFVGGAGNQYQTAAASFGIYLNTEYAASASKVAMASSNGGTPNLSFIRPRALGGTAQARINSTTILSSVNAPDTAIGLFSLALRGGTEYSYKNGVGATSAATASVLPTFSLILLAGNSGGTAQQYTDSRVASSFIGGGLTDAETTTTYNLTLSYLTAVGGN